MAALGLREGLEPVGDLVETFFAGGLRHSRIHVGVFVGLAGDRCLQIGVGWTDWLASRGISALFKELKMAMGMTGLAFGRGTENRCHVVVSFDIRLLSEIEIASVGLRFAGERRLEIIFGLRVLEGRHFGLPIQT